MKNEELISCFGTIFSRWGKFHEVIKFYFHVVFDFMCVSNYILCIYISVILKFLMTDASCIVLDFSVRLFGHEQFSLYNVLYSGNSASAQ